MTEDTTQQLPLTEPGLLESLEETARELASAAGAEITAALGRSVSVDYKGEQKSEDTAPTDPVSEVDRAVEAMIRERLAERFPAHGILGEERDDHPAPTTEYLWAVDPVDGTTNFVNRFPPLRCLHRRSPRWCPDRGGDLVLHEPCPRGRRLPRPQRQPASIRRRTARGRGGQRRRPPQPE